MNYVEILNFFVLRVSDWLPLKNIFVLEMKFFRKSYCNKKLFCTFVNENILTTKQIVKKYKTNNRNNENSSTTFTCCRGS